MAHEYWSLQLQCVHNRQLATGSYKTDAVLRAVNAMGLRTVKGSALTPQSFSQIIRNPLYMGWIHSGENKVKGNFEAIVDEQTRHGPGCDSRQACADPTQTGERRFSTPWIRTLRKMRPVVNGRLGTGTRKKVRSILVLQQDLQVRRHQPRGTGRSLRSAPSDDAAHS